MRPSRLFGRLRNWQISSAFFTWPRTNLKIGFPSRTTRRDSFDFGREKLLEESMLRECLHLWTKNCTRGYAQLECMPIRLLGHRLITTKRCRMLERFFSHRVTQKLSRRLLGAFGSRSQLSAIELMLTKSIGRKCRSHPTDSGSSWQPIRLWGAIGIENLEGRRSEVDFPKGKSDFRSYYSN